MIGLRAVGHRRLVVRRRIVGSVVVCIVVRLGIERVVAALVMRLRATVIVVMVVVGAVGDVFDRILPAVSSVLPAVSMMPARTLGCNCSLSDGVPGPGPGPMGISSGPGCDPYLSSSW
jgi:hypothetical protein